jgi:hypothetical protein
MGYDQVFKGILRRFFRDFMELFFGDVARALDFDSVELPDRELFKGFPDGVERRPDFVVRVRTREGRPEIVIVHIEAQAGSEPRFGRRMFEYYALLWLSSDAPVFPIVLFVKGGGRRGIATRSYRHEVLGREVMKFQYASVALAGFSGREYLEKGALAAALASFMRWEGEPDVVPARADVMNRVASSGLDDEAMFLLINLIETYFPVPEESRERYRQLVSREEYRKVQEVEMTWAERLRQEGHDKGKEEGREEGREQGLIEGKRETLKRQLAAKFRGLPPRVLESIDALRSSQELDRYLDRVLTAATLSELGLPE